MLYLSRKKFIDEAETQFGYVFYFLTELSNIFQIVMLIITTHEDIQFNSMIIDKPIIIALNLDLLVGLFKENF